MELTISPNNTMIGHNHLAIQMKTTLNVSTNALVEFSPYIPKNTCPSSHTIEVFIKHADGSLELNMHSTYGYWEIINTYKAL